MKSTTPRNVIFSCTALVLFLLLLEFILRILTAFGITELARKPGVRELWAREGWIVDKDLNWALIPNHSSMRGGVPCRTNSYGLRDQEIPLEKPPRTFRILVIGDSTVLGFAVPFEKTFTERLETMLNRSTDSVHFDVINAGIPGYSIYNSFTYLKRDGIRFEPDLIVLETNFNDRRYILSREFEDGGEYYRKFYNSLRTREILSRSYLYRGLRRILIDNFNLARKELIDSGEFDYKHIRMDGLHCRVEPERYRTILLELIEFSGGRSIPVILIPLRDSPAHVADLYRASTLADAGKVKESYNLFKNMESLPLYRIIVARKANEILKAHGRDERMIETVPVQIEWMGTDGNIPVYLSDPYVEIMYEMAGKRNVFIVEIDTLTLQKKQLYVDYIHLNEEGHRILAEELYKELLENQNLRVAL
ncbi:MAG: SGNH/GDSL hydrolase family protein [candidate division WOR-3 bacterium]|nr:MAG: SGNH/GDSL hydrolase family protein [candidate division WOR-3 bacterium]UCF06923.1 MAG: SGNH/GDSL hydrolase family protein [bacterium]